MYKFNITLNDKMKKIYIMVLPGSGNVFLLICAIIWYIERGNIKRSLIDKERQCDRI